MRIGELAERTGVSRRSLRYYEEQGLISPDRLPSGYRDYDERTARQVTRIQILLTAGLPIAVIAEILPGVTDDGVVVSGSCPELVDGLAVERQRITGEIERLHAARDILDNLIGQPLDAAPDARPSR